jgi:hypothetical protein
LVEQWSRLVGTSGERENHLSAPQLPASRAIGGRNLNAIDEDFLDAPAERPLEPAKRKRRKYRRYPKPIGTDAEWRAVLEAQGGTCALCDESEDLHRDHRAGWRLLVNPHPPLW